MSHRINHLLLDR